MYFSFETVISIATLVAALVSAPLTAIIQTHLERRYQRMREYATQNYQTVSAYLEAVANYIQNDNYCTEPISVYNSCKNKLFQFVSAEQLSLIERIHTLLQSHDYAEADRLAGVFSQSCNSNLKRTKQNKRNQKNH